MIQTDTLKTYLYWFVVLQVCVISVSIAASSLLLGLIILSILVLFAKEQRWFIPHTAIDVAVLAYIVIEFVTAMNSDYQFDALKNSKRLLLIVMAYAAIIAFDSKKKIRRSVQLLSGAVALLSIAEIILYYADGTERLYVFQHYMTTGGLKMIVSLMLIPFMLSTETDRSERYYYSAVFLPTMFALILTNTRSAWLGLIFGILVMSVVHYRVLFALLFAAVILFFQFAPEQQVARAKSILDFSNSTNIGRFNMWSTGLQMWQDRPLLGFGDIDLYTTYLTYRIPTGDEPAGHLHNNYVHLLVTIGIVGLSVVMFLFYKIIRTEFLVFRKAADDPFVRTIALGALAVFCGFMVNGLFEWNFGDHEIMVFVWFTVGLCISAGRVEGGTDA
ncbi:MAG: O-antigen ligase family protein [Bacteroidetes bacterium]|nr:O-antigen ligase family protein [Bacteroidota bacterium]